MKSWVTFDLDGTLMQNPFGAWIFPEIEELLSGDLNYAFEAKRKLMQAHEGLLACQQTLAAYDWDAIVGRLIQELGLNRTINIEELVLKHSVPPRIYLLDSTIIPGLKRLKQEGYAVAAVTNGYYKYQYPVMKALGITDWLDEIVTPERAGFAKPDVRMVDGLRESGEIIAHVGDRLDHDVVFANRMGTASILINRQMSPSLLALSPKERTRSEAFLPLLEQLAIQEIPELKGLPLSDLYMPAFAISGLDELFNCLESAAAEKSTTERKGTV